MEFDGKTGEQLKLEGMATAAENRARVLATAREVALYLAVPGGITSDTVFKEMRRRGLPSNIGPAAGSLFKCGDWYTRGEWRKSHRKTNHSRMLRVWYLP